MWLKPWKMKEGFLIGGSLLVVGLLLQAIIGPIRWDSIVHPLNTILLIVLLALIALVYVLRRKVYLFEWMTHSQAIVPAWCYALGLTILMGLIRQQEEGGSGPWLSQMLSFWPFVLAYVWLMFLVGVASLDRLLHFNVSETPLLLIHVGLFLALVCGTLGSADTRRVYMTTQEGETEWKAEDDKGNVQELDFAIELHDFIMEEFPMQPGAKMRVPKRFASDVTVHTKAGETVDAVIEVNKPLKVAGWKIYQYDYDSAAGVDSKISIFEIVRDPWRPFILAGILLMIAGAVCLLFMASPEADKKEELL